MSLIVWALKVVMNHLSVRSCKDLNEIFRIMFPDRAIAQQLNDFNYDIDQFGLTVLSLGFFMLIKSLNC